MEKKISKLKLNQLSKVELEERKMNSLKGRGGCVCYCWCISNLESYQAYTTSNGIFGLPEY